MAKKTLYPEAIQLKFNKIQFKINAPVLFTWLGMKKYGYVIRTKETNWGIQYTVDDMDAKYPCGIQIKSHKTTYTTGCILYDDTRSIGEVELKRRIQTNNKRTPTTVYTDATRPEIKSTSNNNSSGRISETNDNGISPKSNTISKVVDKSSITGMLDRNTKKQKNIGLESAFQRQRDFLNGFVNKE